MQTIAVDTQFRWLQAAAGPANQQPDTAGFVRMRRGRQRIRIRSDFAELLVGPNGLELERWDAEVVKHGRHRTVTRWHAHGETLYVKHNRATGWLEFVRNTVSGSRAERELKAIQRVAAAGIATVEPVAVVVEKTNSYLITRGIDETQTLEEIALETDSLNASDRRNLAHQLGSLVGRLHAAGLLHRDLHAGNFLVRRDDDGGFHLWLIDLQTVRRFRRLALRRRARELAMFAHFFLTRSSDTERRRFLTGYYASAGVPKCDRKTLLQLIERESVRWSPRVLRKADEKWLRGHRKLIIVNNQSAHCRGIAELGAETVARVAGNPDTVTDIGHVREYPEDVRAIRWLGMRRRWSAARRIWEFGHALDRRGIAVNRPRLMLEHGSSGAVAFEHLTRPIAPAAATADQFRQAGDLLRRLGEAGFVHTANEPPFAQTDAGLVIDRLEDLEPVSAADASSELARLRRWMQSANGVSPANRLRFLLAWLGPRRRGDWKRIWNTFASQSDATMNARKPRRRFLRAAMLTAAMMLGCTAPDKQILMRPAQHSVRSGPLLVMSDRKIEGNDPAISDLVRLRKQIAVTLNLPAAREEVVVYIFNSEKEYRDYLDSAYPGLPNRRAYFVGTKQELAVYTYWGSRIQEDLRHEYTHGILHASLSTVPLWLDEGLAEYFEVGGARPGNPNSDYAARLTAAMQRGWKPAIERLEAIEEFKQMQHIHYQESWAWVHFLLHHTPETKQVLLSYLSDLKTQRNPRPISKRLREDLPNFEQRFNLHVRTLQQPRLLQEKGYQPPAIKQAGYETPAEPSRKARKPDNSPFPPPTYKPKELKPEVVPLGPYKPRPKPAQKAPPAKNSAPPFPGT